MPTKKRPGNWELKIYPLNHDISKSWFVQLEFTDPVTEETIRDQYRNGINYYKTVKERLTEAKNLIAALEVKLMSGWNPITNTSVSPITHTSLDQLPLNQALDVAMTGKQKTLSTKSFSDINGVVQFTKKAAVTLRLNTLPVSDVRKKHIKLLLDQVAKDRQKAYNKEGNGKKWTGNSYNKYKGFLSIVFTELEDLEAVEFNPCMKISSKKEIKTNIHRHATEREHKLIKKELMTKCPNFYIYIVTEYMTGIRPKELLGLRICDIDWINQTFDIQATDDGSKTDTFRKVPIPNTLLPYLERLRLNLANPEDYIFSRDFKPGPEKRPRKYATDLWRAIIKEGLGINVTMYSYKGKGGEDKRKAGIDEEAVGSGFGHARKSMTRTYLHGEADRINRELIEKTPDF